MCQYGLKSHDLWGEWFVEKETLIMTNSATIAKILSRRCQRGHRHVHLIQGSAAAATKYTDVFCWVICRGFIEQRKADANNVLMLSSLSWKMCEASQVDTDLSGQQATQGRHHELAGEAPIGKLGDATLNQLLGRTSGKIYDGNHEDAGVPRGMEGGKK